MNVPINTHGKPIVNTFLERSKLLGKKSIKKLYFPNRKLNNKPIEIIK